MVAGLALFATFAGFVASWFLAPQEADQEDELESIRLRLTAIVTAATARPRGVGSTLSRAYLQWGHCGGVDSPGLFAFCVYYAACVHARRYSSFSYGIGLSRDSVRCY